MADSSRLRRHNPTGADSTSGRPQKAYSSPHRPPGFNPTGKTKSISEILEAALRINGIGKKASRYSGFHLWAEIVGAEIAAVAEPLKIMRGNVLQVRVVDAVWAQELALRKHEIVGKLSGGELGSVIEDLQFVIQGPRSAKR